MVYQQTRRRSPAGCFENLVHDLRVLLQRLQEHPAAPTAVILDSRTRQSTPESGARAGYDGAKRRKGSQVHVAVVALDTLGDLLAACVSPADEQDHAPSASSSCPTLPHAAPRCPKLPQAKHGFGLLPRRWVVERGFAWAARFRRLARDDERLAATLAGSHFLAFSCLMLHHSIHLMSSS